MHLDSAREIKAQLRRDAGRIRQARALPRTAAGQVAVGICVLGGGTYGVAVRYSGESELGAGVTARARELAGDACDVRDVGIVRALQWQPTELQQRHRPLRPGLSVSHVDVTAGTIGAFVTPVEGDPAEVHILSNNHVLADSDRARPGDSVLQPGTADGGGDPGDRVGTLALVAPLDTDGLNVVDAATARLDEGVQIDGAYPDGALSGWADARDDVDVEKVGRTTGLTTGRVTAIEIDDVSVEYPLGAVDFEDQIEIEGVGGAFSAGGDSGSIVYRAGTLEAIGLLFAGSERGGENGQGLTYCNPVGMVLSRLGVRLLGASVASPVPGG